ncbi:MAG: hypothetical protein ACKPKO_18365, partial [Candidatus Fonsibacter sp.]
METAQHHWEPSEDTSISSTGILTGKCVLNVGDIVISLAKCTILGLSGSIVSQGTITAVGTVTTN